MPSEQDDSTRTTREKRDSRYTTLSYECDECGLLIKGHSGDIQEAPWLYCPECDEEMNFAVKHD